MRTTTPHALCTASFLFKGVCVVCLCAYCPLKRVCITASLSACVYCLWHKGMGTSFAYAMQY